MAPSLGQRLLMVTIAGIAPMLAVLAYNEVSVRQARYKELRELALTNAQQASLEMERLMAGAENVLKAVSAAPVVKTFDTDRCGAYLAELKDRVPELSAIVVYDLKGASRCRSDAALPGADPAERRYFDEALRSPGKRIIGDYTPGQGAGTAVLPIALAISGQDGRSVGVAAANLDLAWLGRSLKARQFKGNASLTIADRNGTIIAREPEPQRFIGTKIPPPYLSLVTADRVGVREVQSQDGTRRVLGYIPAPLPPTLGLYLSAGISVDDAFSPVNRGTWRAVVIAALASCMSLFLALLLSRQLVQGPVRRIQRVLTAWRRGKQRIRTGMSSQSGEIEALGAEFDAFMDELVIAKAEREKAEERRQLMTRELSHRLKNIIATIQSVASQSLRKTADPEALTAFMQRLGSIAQAHDLLLRDESGGAMLLTTIVTAIDPFANAGNSNFSLNGPDFKLKPSAVQSLSMALHELCTNAAKYGALSLEAGRIEIEWMLGREDEDIFCLVWREIGGPPVEQPKSTGFGSKMIERVLAAELSAQVKLDYQAQGVVCRIDAPLRAIIDGGPSATHDETPAISETARRLP